VCLDAELVVALGLLVLLLVGQMGVPGGGHWRGRPCTVACGLWLVVLGCRKNVNKTGHIPITRVIFMMARVSNSPKLNLVTLDTTQNAGWRTVIMLNGWMPLLRTSQVG
jgi:hypothetical protein